MDSRFVRSLFVVRNRQTLFGMTVAWRHHQNFIVGNYGSQGRVINHRLIHIFSVFGTQKNDKWQKMINQEENLVILTDFLEKGESLVLVIYVNQQGQLTPINDFPTTSKNKVQIDAVLEVA